MQPAFLRSITEEDVPETIAPAEEGKREAAQNAKSADERNGFDHFTSDRKKNKKSKKDEDLFANRKPITEVLHDIYDRKS